MPIAVKQLKGILKSSSKRRASRHSRSSRPSHCSNLNSYERASAVPAQKNKQGAHKLPHRGQSSSACISKFVDDGGPSCRLGDERRRSGEAKERYGESVAALTRETKEQMQRHEQQEQQLQQRLAAVTAELKGVKLRAEQEPARLERLLEEKTREAESAVALMP